MRNTICPPKDKKVFLKGLQDIRGSLAGGGGVSNKTGLTPKSRVMLLMLRRYYIH